MARSAAIATAYVHLQPEISGLKAALDKEIGGPLQASAAKAGTDAGRSFSDKFVASGQQLSAFGTKATVVGGLMVAAFGGAANAAGNLEAAIAANEQVLGSASRVAQTWAKDSVNAVGLSERAALEASTSFAGLGKIMGLTGNDVADFSIEMVKAAADMAAFKDVSVDEALADLQSGFAGASLPLRKYNIFLDEAGLKQAYFEETGERVTGVLTAQQRIIATHSEIVRQGADMWGQWGREFDELGATQSRAKAAMENMAASIGTAFLPAAATAFELVAKGARGFAGLNDATGGAIAQIAGFTGVGTLAVGVLAKVAGAAANTVGWFRGLSSTGRLAAGGLGAVGLAVGVGMSVWGAYKAKQEAARLAIDNAARSLMENTREAWENARAAEAAGKAVDGTALAYLSLSRTLLAQSDGGELAEALGAIGLNAEDAAVALVKLGSEPVSALTELATQAGLTGEEAAIVGEAVSKVGVNALNVIPRLFEVAEGLGYTGEEAEAFVARLSPLAHGLNEVRVQADGMDLSAVARQTLTAAVGTGEWSDELVRLAEAQVGASRNSEQAVDVFLAVHEIYGQAGDATRDLYMRTDELGGALSDVGDSAGDAKDGLDGVNKVAASSVELVSQQEAAFARAAREASAFGSALDDLIGDHLDLQAAEDRMIEVVNELTASFRDNGTTLDQNTEAGRANREAFRRAAEQAMTTAKAMLDTGSSVDEASDAMLAQIDVLGDVMRAAGFAEDEIAAYNETLGLTPEEVRTAVEVAGDELMKAKIEDVQSKLDEIPAEVASEIQALIDRSSYDEALRKFEELTKTRTMRINVSGGGSVRVGNMTMYASAWGNYFDRPAVTSVAEDGAAEAVLTLEKPDNLARQLADPRIGMPIVEALGKLDSKGSGVAVQMSGPVTIQDATDVDRVAQAIMSRWAVAAS